MQIVCTDHNIRGGFESVVVFFFLLPWLWTSLSFWLSAFSPNSDFFFSHSSLISCPPVLSLPVSSSSVSLALVKKTVLFFHSERDVQESVWKAPYISLLLHALHYFLLKPCLCWSCLTSPEMSVTVLCVIVMSVLFSSQSSLQLLPQLPLRDHLGRLLTV